MSAPWAHVKAGKADSGYYLRIERSGEPDIVRHGDSVEQLIAMSIPELRYQDADPVRHALIAVQRALDAKTLPVEVTIGGFDGIKVENEASAGASAQSKLEFLAHAFFCKNCVDLVDPSARAAALNHHWTGCQGGLVVARRAEGLSDEAREPLAPDALVFGEKTYVYCTEHLNPHLTGWCTIEVDKKVGLGIKHEGHESRERARDKCRSLGLRLFQDR